MFWRAKLARASRMDWLFWAGGAAGAGAGALPWREAIKLGGGLPGGVVETPESNEVRTPAGANEPRQGMMLSNLLGGDARSFSLNDSTMDAGKVCPFSHMSRSFFIFSYKIKM